MFIGCVHPQQLIKCKCIGEKVSDEKSHKKRFDCISKPSFYEHALVLFWHFTKHSMNESIEIKSHAPFVLKHDQLYQEVKFSFVDATIKKQVLFWHFTKHSMNESIEIKSHAPFVLKHDQLYQEVKFSFVDATIKKQLYLTLHSIPAFKKGLKTYLFKKAFVLWILD
jgi:hypothetical protein